MEYQAKLPPGCWLFSGRMKGGHFYNGGYYQVLPDHDKPCKGIDIFCIQA